jgi:hypothetical protein
VILDNCGPPLLCPEYPMIVFAGQSVQQKLSVTGVAFQPCDFSSEGCTMTGLAPGPYAVTATFYYRIGSGWSGPEYAIQETVDFNWPPQGAPIDTPTPSPTVQTFPTRTPSATGTATRTCASLPSPPSCPAGEGAACEDQQCMVGCGCGTVTPTATPTNTCTPGANPPPGCRYEGPTFTVTPLCDNPHLTPTPIPSIATCAPTLGIPSYCATHCEPCPTIRAGCFAESCRDCIENPVCGPGEGCVPLNPANPGCCSCATATPTPTVDPIVACGNAENVAGCCSFFGEKPCYQLEQVGYEAATCRDNGGVPLGCFGSMVCNATTGLCEPATPYPHQ